jgi:hypothetical protein
MYSKESLSFVVKGILLFLMARGQILLDQLGMIGVEKAGENSTSVLKTKPCIFNRLFGVLSA